MHHGGPSQWFGSPSHTKRETIQWTNFISRHINVIRVCVKYKPIRQINYKRPWAQWACALTAPQSVHHGGPSQWFVNFEQA